MKLKRFAKMLVCLMLALIISLPLTQPVNAEKIYKGKITIKTLKPGQTAKGQNTCTYEWTNDGSTYTRTYKYTVYKITVKKPGYLTITNNTNDHYQYLYLFNTKPTLDDQAQIRERDKNDNRLPVFVVVGEKKTVSYPVSKGTYYACFTGTGFTYNFKYTFTKAAVTGKNYCAAQAEPLKAKKTAVICAPIGYTYNRWYKITLTKKKRLNINFTDMKILKKDATDSPDFSLYDADFKQLDTVHDDGFNYASVNQLAKGTYYIRVYGYVSDYRLGSFLYKLTWK